MLRAFPITWPGRGRLAAPWGLGGRVRDPVEVAGRLGVPLLGTIPVAPGWVGPGTDLGAFVRGLDRVRDSVFLSRGRPGRCVLVASPSAGDGKTLVASQVAGRCSAAGLVTLLVEVAREVPTLARMFDRAEDWGLSEILDGAISAEDAIRPVVEAGFHFLPAGSGRGWDAGAFSAFLRRARASFDALIVDGEGPSGLARSVDGALLVVRAGARFPEVERAANRLAEAGPGVLGVVANGFPGRSIDDSGDPGACR